MGSHFVNVTMWVIKVPMWDRFLCPAFSYAVVDVISIDGIASGFISVDQCLFLSRYTYGIVPELEADLGSC